MLWDINKIKNACKISRTISETLRNLNIKTIPGNYRHFKKIINKYNIDISHFNWIKDYAIRI